MTLGERLRTQRAQTAVLVMLIAITSLYLYNTQVYTAALPRIEEDSTRAAAMEKENRQVRQSIASLGVPRLQARILRAKNLREALENLIPPRDSVLDILGTLNQAAASAGVQITSVRPDSTTPAVGGYTKRSYQVTALGGYEPLGVLLTSLASQPHIARPVKVRIRSAVPDNQVKSTERPRQLRMIFVLETFWHTTPLDSLASDNIIPTMTPFGPTFEPGVVEGGRIMLGPGNRVTGPTYPMPAVVPAPANGDLNTQDSLVRASRSRPFSGTDQRAAPRRPYVSVDSSIPPVSTRRP